MAVALATPLLPASVPSAFAAAPLGNTSALGSWDQLGGDPGHSGDATANRGLNPAALPKLRRIWSFAPRGGLQGHYLSSAIANGVLYEAAGFGNSDPSSRKAYVRAIDLRTGRVLWISLPLGHRKDLIYAQPAVANGVVIVNGYQDWDKRKAEVFGYDAASGRQLWHTPVAAAQPLAPTVVGNVAYVSSTSIGKDTTEVVALRIDTGRAVWRRTLTDWYQAPLVFAAGRLLLTGVGDRERKGLAAMYALNPATGATEWKRSLPSHYNPRLAAAGDAVYGTLADTPSYGHIASVCGWSAKTGRTRWCYRVSGFPGGSVSGPAVADGTVYTPTYPSGRAHFVALDAKTGKARWNTALGPNYLAAAPVVLPGAVLFQQNVSADANAPARLRALATSNGATLLDIQCDQKQSDGFVSVADNTVVVQSYAHLAAYRVHN